MRKDSTRVSLATKRKVYRRIKAFQRLSKALPLNIYFHRSTADKSTFLKFYITRRELYTFTRVLRLYSFFFNSYTREGSKRKRKKMSCDINGGVLGIENEREANPVLFSIIKRFPIYGGTDKTASFAYQRKKR